MRVAIFKSNDEILILQVKGSVKGPEAIDGYAEYFGINGGGRDIKDYDVEMTHLGDGDGIVITSETKTDLHGRNVDIGDWFPQHDDEN